MAGRTNRIVWIAAAVAAMGVTACNDLGTGLGSRDDPRNLVGTYHWVFGGFDDGQPYGYPTVELTWDLPRDGNFDPFRVWARGRGSYELIATVTSCIDGFCRYVDMNVREGDTYDYYVTTVDEWDGADIGSSSDVRVTVPVTPVLDRPTNVATVALDGAAYLQWDATGAQLYEIWVEPEGQSLFVIGETDGTSYLDDRAENGTRYRYWIAAVDAEGHRSALSSGVDATPRPDYHADILYSFSDQPDQSGFRFVTSDDQNPILGGSSASAQWRLEEVGGALQIQPLGGSRITLGTFTTQLTCGPGSESNCVDVPVAPSDGSFASSAVTVESGYTYVLSVTGGDGRRHYGKLRVQGTSVDSAGRSLMIFDWAYQLRPDDPSLVVGVPGSSIGLR